MSDEKLWIASVKARVLENCELDSDGSEFQFFECLFSANSADQIVTEIKSIIPTMRLQLIEISKCGVYVPQEWQNDDPLIGELIQEAADEAKTKKKLTFGPFTSSNFLSN